MKILIISFTFPPNKDGVSEAAAAMALGFAGRGWEVTILTEETDPERETGVWNGVAITGFSNIDGPKPDIRIHGRDCSYEDFLVSGDWDVVVIHAYTRPLMLVLPFLNRIRARKILVSHGYAALLWVRYHKFPYGLVSWFRNVLASIQMPFWIRHFDRVVYLSEQADFRGFYDHLIAKVTGYRGRRVIPNGVNLSERGTDPAGFRVTHGISPEAFVFLCVANYSPRKDQGYAARAFRNAAIGNSVLVFIGSDFNEHSHAFQASDAVHHGMKPPGRIIWLEKQPREDTLNALSSCNAFVLSANHEAQPIALLEAMREGKPWIARDAGCIARMEGGICVKSEGEMADAMIRLSSDESLQTRLGQEGKRAVSTRYSRSAYVDSYCELIEEWVHPDL
jgi:glycosyltransferase involved in cell wall biosynthesis